MKKLILIASVLLVSLSLSGCFKQSTEENLISFAKYNFPVGVEDVFVKQASITTKNEILKNKIIAQYHRENDDSGFQDSILILKDSSNTKEIADFAQDLLDKAVENGQVIEKQSEDTFRCNEEKIYGELALIEMLSENRNTYIVQYFFKDVDTYIISFATDELEKYENFAKSIKDINCALLDNK